MVNLYTPVRKFKIPMLHGHQIRTIYLKLFWMVYVISNFSFGLKWTVKLKGGKQTNKQTNKKPLNLSTEAF